MHREGKHSITVGKMSGVFQNAAEQDVLECHITSYFTDTVHRFVNEFQLAKIDVYTLEDSIMKQLTVSCAPYA